MKSTIFRQICQHLDNELNAQPVVDVYGKLKYMARWNNQLENLIREEAITYPAIFIGFPNAEWSGQTNNHQQGDMVIDVYIVQHNQHTTNWFAKNAEFEEGMKRDEYVQQVHNRLEGQQVASGSMTRTGQFEDNNHDQIMVDQLRYVAAVEDTCADPRANWQEVTNTDLEVENDQDLQIPTPAPQYNFDLSGRT